MSTKKETSSSLRQNVIRLRSVYGKVGMKYYIQPCRDPKTGRYPDCVKAVNSQGDIIMTDNERNSGKYFIKETDVFIIEDGKTFNLDDEIENAQWQAIKNCSLIAPDRYAKDSSGRSLIDGTTGWTNKQPRYGVAELYIERPGEETARKVSKKKKIHQAASYVLDDTKGSEGRLLIARLLGKNMKGQPDADVEDYLLSISEKEPDKIIELYTGSDTTLRLLFIEAKDKRVIYLKNKLYLYGDNVVLGATDDAVITWMKEPKNKKILELIRKDTYPDLYPSEEEKN